MNVDGVELDRIRNEAKMMAGINHENIIKLKRVTISKKACNRFTNQSLIYSL